ncbi:prion-inhibition and propagation-domain-containing protein [Schizophyllum commune]
MEVAGLVIGATSILALWETCVQVFDIVVSGQNYGMDSEIARVKLEVERVRLLMWGQAVGLSNVRLPEEGVTSPGPCHPRLGRPEVTDAVMRILGCIHHLFKDTDALQRRYGLQRTSERSSALAALDISPENNASSATILESVFKKAYASLQKSSRRNNRITTLRKRAHWAILDKTKFSLLVQEIRAFNDSLSALFPDVSTETQDSLRQDIEASDEIASLRLLQQASANDYAELSDTASERVSLLEERASLAGSEAPAVRVVFDPETFTIRTIRPVPTERMAPIVEASPTEQSDEEVYDAEDNTRWHVLFRDDRDRGVQALERHTLEAHKVVDWFISFLLVKINTLSLVEYKMQLLAKQFVEPDISGHSRPLCGILLNGINKEAEAQAPLLESFSACLAAANELKERYVNFQSKFDHLRAETRAKQKADFRLAKAREAYESARYRIATLTRKMKHRDARGRIRTIQIELSQAQQQLAAAETTLDERAAMYDAAARRWERVWRETCDKGQALEQDRLHFARDLCSRCDHHAAESYQSLSVFIISISPTHDAIALGKGFRARVDVNDEDGDGPPPAPFASYDGPKYDYEYQGTASYSNRNVLAWAKYYDMDGTDPAGAVYFHHVPGVSDEPEEAPLEASSAPDSQPLEPRSPVVTTAPHSPPAYHAQTDERSSFASNNTSLGDEPEPPLPAGLYHALFDFQAENSLEQSLAVGDVVNVVEGSGGYGWAVIARADVSDPGSEYALVPRAFLEPVQGTSESASPRMSRAIAEDGTGEDPSAPNKLERERLDPLPTMRSRESSGGWDAPPSYDLATDVHAE